MEYDMLKTKLFDKYPQVFPAEVFTWDNYLWAFINIFSRAIRVGRCPQEGGGGVPSCHTIRYVAWCSGSS